MSEIRTKLEQRFRELSAKTENEILIAKWENDKRQVPSALKNVGVIFPHYSMHDETHSISIINNITNMLGEEAMDSLSAIDLWLILESAYWHDIGMVVTADRIKDALTDGSFLKYFRYLKEDSSHPYYKYAKCFEIENNKILYKKVEFNPEFFDAVKFLLSGYFRSRHAKNSLRIINNPKDELGMRSSIFGIPERINKILGDICFCHGREFDDIMALPYVENGLGLDKAHPRFIACLLRLGDYLDMDDNRFSEVALRTICEVPEESIQHYEKHQSITHIRIDNEHIEIASKCSTPQAAKVVNDWFDGIAKEFKNQICRWNDIKPRNSKCYLPTIDNLSVEIEGYYQSTIKDKPSFTIDTSKALELLQGQNLYENPFESIRELIQNAVDSTLIHFFLDNEYKLPFGIDDDFLKKMDNYPIEISFNKEKDENYYFAIKDKGIGLKRDHLRFLSNTGNSSGNIEKNEIIERMPNWMRPSGTFGIGFQSVFLITDKVDIITKDYFTDEYYGLEMYSPTSPMKGEIYIRKEKHIADCGFEMKFKINSKLFKNNVVDPFEAVRTFDTDNEIWENVKKYALFSYVPISFNGTKIERLQQEYFDNETGVEFFCLTKQVENKIEYTKLLYKNAIVEYIGRSLPLFTKCIVNLHCNSAKSFLNISRNSIIDEHNVNENVIKAFKKYISNRNSSENADGLKLLSNAQLFALYYGISVLSNGIRQKLTDVNIKSLVKTKCGELKIQSIIESNHVYFSIFSGVKETSISVNEDNSYSIVRGMFSDDISTLLFKLLQENFNHNYIYKDDDSITSYVFYKTKGISPEISFSDMSKVRFDISAKRKFIHYIPYYDDICIDSDKGNELNIDIVHHNILGYTTKFLKILSPFLLVNGMVVNACNDKFYEYVSVCNGKDIDKIKSCYEKFVNFVKEKYELDVKTLEQVDK